jgi:GT2 family glycosyltransferase
MTNPRELAVVVPVMYNFKGCVEMFDSINYPFFPIIMNNSEDNKGVARSWNLGLLRSIELGIGNVLVTNDDVIYEPDAIRKMMDSLASEGRMFTSALNTRDYTLSPGEGYDDEAEFAGFMVHPRQFVKKVGWFDEHFFPGYFEDNDMHYRMKLAGMSETRRTDAGMYHKGSVTQFWNGDDEGRVVSHAEFDRNKMYYKTKWGGEPGQETFTTPHGLGGSFKEWA